MPDRIYSKFPVFGCGLLPYGHHFHIGETVEADQEKLTVEKKVARSKEKILRYDEIFDFRVF